MDYGETSTGCHWALRLARCHEGNGKQTDTVEKLTNYNIFYILGAIKYLGSKSYFTWGKQSRADCEAHSHFVWLYSKHTHYMHLAIFRERSFSAHHSWKATRYLEGKCRVAITFWGMYCKSLHSSGNSVQFWAVFKWIFFLAVLQSYFCFNGTFSKTKIFTKLPFLLSTSSECRDWRPFFLLLLRKVMWSSI